MRDLAMGYQERESVTDRSKTERRMMPWFLVDVALHEFRWYCTQQFPWISTHGRQNDVHGLKLGSHVNYGRE